MAISYTSVLEFLRRRKLLFGIVSVLLLALIVFFVLRNNPRSGYVFEKVEKTPLTEIVSESGTITALGNTPVYSSTNGKVANVSVENGQEVKEGQDLFTVDSSATKQEQQNALATYLTAKAALDASNANLYALQSTMFSTWKIYTDIATNSTFENADKSPNTNNRVLTEFTTAQADWLSAEANYKNQQSVIAKDQATVNSAHTAYLATQTSTVTAPIDGIAENISVSKGTTVAAQSLLSLTAKPVLLIKTASDLEAVIPVGQTNIAKIKIGQQAIIKPDAYKDKTYTAQVIRIDALGENIQGVVTYNVYLSVKQDEMLRAGMTFDADITTKSLGNVLTVPNAAVVIDKGLQTVRVFDKTGVKYIPVIAGVKGETRTQILKGLTDGQEIITALTNERATRPSFLGL